MPNPPGRFDATIAEAFFFRAIFKISHPHVYWDVLLSVLGAYSKTETENGFKKSQPMARRLGSFRRGNSCGDYNNFF